MTKPAKPICRIKAGSTPASNGVVCPDCSCANGCAKKATPAEKPKRARTKKGAAAVATPVAPAAAAPNTDARPFADMPGFGHVDDPLPNPQPENAMTDTTKPAPTLVVTDTDRERHADLTGEPAPTVAPAPAADAPKAEAPTTPPPTDAAPAAPTSEGPKAEAAPATDAPKTDTPTDAAPAAPASEGPKAETAPAADAPKAEEAPTKNRLKSLAIISAMVLVIGLLGALAWLWLTKPGPVIPSDLDTPPAAGAPNLAPLPSLPQAVVPAPVAPAPQVTAPAPAAPAPAPVAPAPQAVAPAPVVPPVVAAPPAVSSNGVTATARASAQGPNARAEAEVTVGPANRAPARTAAPRATFEERPYPTLDPDARVIYNFRDRTVTFVPGSYGYDIGGTGTVTYDSLNSEYKREFDRLCREFRACS